MSIGNNTDRLHELLGKEHWTEEDQLWLLHYLNSTRHSELWDMLQEKFEKDAIINQPDAKAEQLLILIQEKIGSENKKENSFYFNNRKRIMIAASVILILGSGVLSYIYHTTPKHTVTSSISTPLASKDEVPGKENALLTLSDGSVIALDKALDGTLAQQGNSKVLKTKGQIAYDITNSSTVDALPVYNAISTAKGNQYQLILSDGSKVWLNAASSIRFPVGFTKKERRVEITGEVYFEVVPLYLNDDVEKNNRQKIPFIVNLNTTSGHFYEVQVLGTRFNINAYDDEQNVSTTLLEGSVKIKNEGVVKMLVPGEQAVLNKESEKLKVQPADVEEAIAWQMGMFEFHDAKLPGIMRQLSRWYDVEVKFSGTEFSKLYNGSIRRQATLSQALQILKLSGVKYSVEGRTVTIFAN